MLRILLVRHGQSEANLANLWQGQGDSALSDEGRQQAKRLAERLAPREVDLVVSSDLARARETAEALGAPLETDPAWREMDLGSWEGRTFEEVARLHPDLLEAIRAGEAIAFGETGETIAEFEARALAAFDRLAERVGSGTVVVATHGGVIDAVVGRSLGRHRERRTFPISTNTAITALEGEPGRMRLSVFNDASHLGHDVGFLGRMRAEGVPVVGFLRHGVTRANKERRIQGQSCWGLDEEGHAQARAFAAWYGPVDRVVSSPLQRARETAAALSASVEEEPDAREMGFGEWEGLAYDELLQSDDELARRIYRDGEDLPRGVSGESFRQLTDRMAGFLARLEVDPSQRTVVVSHGAAIRAVIASLTGHEEINRWLGTPGNTAISHVAFTPDGPMIADFSLAPHLERW